MSLFRRESGMEKAMREVERIKAKHPDHKGGFENDGFCDCGYCRKHEVKRLRHKPRDKHGNII